MRTIVATVAVAACLVAGPAGAASCTVLTDPAADVTASGFVPVPQDAHLDVRAVDVTAGAGALVLRIRDTDVDPRRLGEWRLTFRAGRTRLFAGGGTGMWLNVGEYRGTFGFRAGIDGERSTAVSGTVDAARNEIRLTVPYAAFGRAAVGPGTALTSFAVEAKEALVNVGASDVSAQLPLVDLGSSGRTYVVGRAC